jgi:hypothetical protein
MFTFYSNFDSFTINNRAIISFMENFSNLFYALIGYIFFTFSALIIKFGMSKSFGKTKSDNKRKILTEWCYIIYYLLFLVCSPDLFLQPQPNTLN